MIQFLPPPLTRDWSTTKLVPFSTSKGGTGNPRAGGGGLSQIYPPTTPFQNEHYHLDVAYSATTRLAVMRSGSAAPARRVTSFGQRIQEIR